VVAGSAGGALKTGQYLKGNYTINKIHNSIGAALGVMNAAGQPLDDFGDADFWGGALRLHEAIAGAANGGIGPGLSPKAALGLGLKVDVAALPAATQTALKASQVNLDDPATTLALLQLDAVVGLTGFFDGAGSLRSIGIPARYISGYMETDPPPGKARLVGADASHAWLTVYCPQVGWIAVDPTNNLLPSDRHITVAWGRDFNDVSPIRGVILGGGAHALKVQVDVVPAEQNVD